MAHDPSIKAMVKLISNTQRITEMPSHTDRYAKSNSSGSGFGSGQPSHCEFPESSKKLLHTNIADLPVALYSVDHNGIFTLLAGEGLEPLGLRAEQVFGKSIFDVFSDYPQIVASIHCSLAGEESTWMGEVNGCVYENRTIPLLGETGEVTGLLGMTVDVTRKMQDEEHLRLLAAAVEHAKDSILITSTKLIFPGPEIVFVNKAFTEMTGYTPEDALGQSPRILQGPKTDRAVLDRLLQNLEEGQIFYGEAINYRKDGTEFYNEWHIEPIRNATGEIKYYLGIQRDITQRKLAEAKLRHEAFHDALTGLPNRAFFINQLRTCVERVQECQDYLFAVLFLDLDRFKVINDSLGHQAGDKLLVAIASRLKACLRTCDTIARVGGDEFAILLDNLTDIGDVSQIANRLQAELQEPIELAGQEILTTASIGIAISMLWYDYPEDILRDADIAMYRAKTLGKARCVVFNKIMHRKAVNRLQLETDLRRAIARQELRLYYQPIVCLATGRISGFEALIRWQHSTRGLVSPAEFIPVAEETGLIAPIGEWVLQEACVKLMQWQQTFPEQKSLTINVNLSGRQLLQPELTETINRILRDTGVERQSVNLEITESAIMENAESAIWEIQSEAATLQAVGFAPIAILEQLKLLGVHLSIDDFGTGYSSLSRLYRFPINTLKIDQSFIRRMNVGEQSQDSASPYKIVKAIVTLAHNLGLDVTAEGIETPEQLAELRKLGCEFGQGYLFSKPVDAVTAEALLAAQPQW